MPKKSALDTYFVRYTDGSTGWLFVESGADAPTLGDVYEGDERTVGTAALQTAEHEVGIDE